MNLPCHPAIRPLALLALLVLAEGCVHAQPQPETVMVAMRDGIQLATDIYKPDGPGPWPAVATRTPYGKSNFASEARLALREGYAFVVQDMRGRFKSQGLDSVFLDDAWGEKQDGYDCIEWIAKQPWCTGSIGMAGGSAMGITQYMAAGALPPHLKCCWVVKAAPSLYHHAVRYGGVLRKEMVEGWLTANGFRPENMRLVKAHPDYDALWQTVDLTTRASQVTTPMIHQAGWFDCFQGGNLYAYDLLQHHGGEGAKGNQVLIIGPDGHGKEAAQALHFPANAKRELGVSELPWINHWLKGTPLDLAQVPHVCYYVMGAVGEAGAPGNEWRTADDWPPPAQATPYYFAASGGLTTERPGDENAKRTYQFDPNNPVTTLGGCNLILAKGSMDQRKMEDRPDVLVFTSPVLQKPLEVTGHIIAKLWISSDCPDTDFTAKLTDVYPDGRSQLVCDGIQRARYRKSFEKPEPLAPGQVYEVEMDCWSTSLIFNTGHALRVAISSSNYPRFSANPNTGAATDDGPEKSTATNTVYLGGARASCIILPVR